MDFGRFLTTSWQITWRHKFLWLFGLLLSLEAISNSLIRLTVGPDILTRLNHSLEQWLTQPEQLVGQVDQWLQHISEGLLSNAFTILLALLLIWFIVTLALAIIISTTLSTQVEFPARWGTVIKQGKGLLLRFIALDTLIYLPLFLALLLIMIIFASTIIGTAMTAWQPEATTATMLTPLLIGGLCLLPLACLLIPLSLLTALFRTLALRATAVYPTTIRQTISHTWATLKSHTADILILGLLLWGLHMLINLILRLPIGFFYPQVTATAPPRQIAMFLFEGVILLIQAITKTFTAVTWTVAYQTLAKQQPA